MKNLIKVLMVISIVVTAAKQLLELFDVNAYFEDTYIIIYLSAVELVTITFTLLLIFYLAIRK